MLFIFPLNIRKKYQEYASYVNTDKTNIIYTSIQTQRIKLKEVRLEVLKFIKTDSKQRTKFAKRNFKRHTAV